MHTGLRSIRVPDNLWLAARVEAARRHETVTSAIIRFLTEYTRGEDDHSGQLPTPAR